MRPICFGPVGGKFFLQLDNAIIRRPAAAATIAIIFIIIIIGGRSRNRFRLLPPYTKSEFYDYCLQ